MKVKQIGFLFALAASALSMLSGGDALAAYPERIIKIVVPFAPGGGTDVVARTLAQEMAKDLGVSIIIENKPGAGTSSARRRSRRARPTGTHC
jgi:tripartite-type tricarboxylate transporter receptor subunit TctC